MYRLKRFLVFLFAATITLAGFLMLLGMLVMWSSTQEWSTTQATVRKFDTRAVPGNSNEFEYSLLYEFNVNGQDYDGEMISPRYPDFILNRAESSRYSTLLRPGKIVEVIYFPESPGEKSFIERISLNDILWTPGGTLLFGLWILYLLRMTRVRKVPQRVFQNAEDFDTPHWHSIYQTVLTMEQIEIRGTAWYSRSGSLTQWPNSRVGLVATPNTIGVIRGPFTLKGALAAIFTAVLEFFLSSLLAVVHAGAFLFEWLNRQKTWRLFEQKQDPNHYSTSPNTADIVCIDDTIIHGYDPKRHELWFRLPSRPVDDCIKLAPEMIQEIEQFIGYVRLMQRANAVAIDDHAVIEEIEIPD